MCGNCVQLRERRFSSFDWWLEEHFQQHQNTNDNACRHPVVYLSRREKIKLLIFNNDLFKKIKPGVKQLLFDEDFIDQVNESIKLFDPICKLINVAQKSDASLAYVAQLWITLKLPENSNYLADQLERRQIMGLNIYAICAYYLHPKFQDDSKKTFGWRPNTWCADIFDRESWQRWCAWIQCPSGEIRHIWNAL